MRVISSAASRSWPAIRRTSSTFIPLMAFTAGFPSPWLARPRCAPVERSCSGGAVAGVLVDSLTLERGPSSGHGEESPWGQRRGMSFLGAGRGHAARPRRRLPTRRSEEHTSELQSRVHLVCRLLLDKKKE